MQLRSLGFIWIVIGRKGEGKVSFSQRSLLRIYMYVCLVLHIYIYMLKN